MSRTIPDTYKMPFGDHKGKEIGSVPASYLDWLVGQPWIKKWGRVYTYIKENREAIDKELEEEEEPGAWPNH